MVNEFIAKLCAGSAYARYISTQTGKKKTMLFFNTSYILGTNFVYLVVCKKKKINLIST